MFVIVADHLESEAVAALMVERIQAAVMEPVSLNGGPPTVVTASAGIAITAGSDAAPETLIRDADAAMTGPRKLAEGNSRSLTA